MVVRAFDTSLKLTNFFLKGGEAAGVYEGVSFFFFSFFFFVRTRNCGVSEDVSLRWRQEPSVLFTHT